MQSLLNVRGQPDILLSEEVRTAVLEIMRPMLLSERRDLIRRLGEIEDTLGMERSIARRERHQGERTK